MSQCFPVRDAAPDDLLAEEDEYELPWWDTYGDGYDYEDR